MLTIAPVVAVTALVCVEPGRWGGAPTPVGILVMAFLGVFTVPLWPTYIPSIIATPLVMNRIAAHDGFFTLSVPALLGLSLLAGAVAGMCVMLPVILLALADSLNLAMNWALAGTASGGVTGVLISAVYRWAPRRV
jgi:hypothetical protein